MEDVGGSVGRLRCDAPIGNIGIAVLILEYFAVPFLIDSFGGREDAGPIFVISQLDVGIAEISLFFIDLFKQFQSFGLGLLPELVEIFPILL